MEIIVRAGGSRTFNNVSSYFWSTGEIFQDGKGRR
jgi:hypothetical protein